MKKPIAVLAVLLFAAPAMAADWSFYGSQRIATYYTDRDYGDETVNGQDDDQDIQWFFQGNSRLGARVKADKVSGRIELGLGQGGDGGDTAVRTRLAHGIWKFSDNAFLKVGKDNSPVTDFISNQVYDTDANLLGNGNFFGRRPSGVTLGLGDFELAFLQTSYGSVGTTANGINGATGGDPDSYFPRLEACYMLKLGAGYLKPFAGWQYYTVEANGIGTVQDDLDVMSYVLGLSTSWNIGAFSIGGQLSYGMNQGNVTGWSTGSNARTSSSAYLSTSGRNIKDVYTLQALLVPALKFSDTLQFEAGLGFRQDNADDAPGYSQKDELWAAYLQAMITLAPGVFLCPEVGYYDYMDGVNGADQGNEWYAGAKWQINF